jgi:transposase
MQYDAGIDVSLEQSSVCVVDAAGKIVKEAKVATDPHVLVTFFKGLGFPVTRIGLEAGPLSQWLYVGLTQARFDVVLLETRDVKAALSAMVVKTDRKDARGIAQLIRMGCSERGLSEDAVSKRLPRNPAFGCPSSLADKPTESNYPRERGARTPDRVYQTARFRQLVTT